MNNAAPPTYSELANALALAEHWVGEHRFQMSSYTIAEQIAVDLGKIRAILDRVHKHAPEMLTDD